MRDHVLVAIRAWCFRRGVVGVLLVFFACTADADDSATADKPEDKVPTESTTTQTMPEAPTDITSDSMDFDVENRRAIFTGNVQVVDDALTLNADSLYIHFDENNKLEEIVADGNVVATSGENKAKGGKALYDFRNGHVVLSNNPELIRGKNRIIDADIIIYKRNEGKFETRRGRPRILWFDDRKDASPLSDLAPFGNTGDKP